MGKTHKFRKLGIPYTLNPHLINTHFRTMLIISKKEFEAKLSSITKNHEAKKIVIIIKNSRVLFLN